MSLCSRPSTRSYLLLINYLLKMSSYLCHPCIPPRRYLISVVLVFSSGRDLISVTLAFIQDEILSRSSWSSHQGEILSRSPWPSLKTRSYLGRLGLLIRSRSYLSHADLNLTRDHILVDMA